MRYLCSLASTHFTYHQVLRIKTLCSALTVYLRVLYGSQNKQRLFPYTALTEWFFYNRDGKSKGKAILVTGLDTP
jgi:hypothetical protein